MSKQRGIGVLVNGSKGRMGARIVELLGDDARFALAAAIDVDDDDRAGAEALRFGSTDVIIDFSSDAGAARAARLAVALKAALVVGTTGLSRGTQDALEAAGRVVPVLVAANTSLGVAVLAHLAAEAARLLGPDFSVDIVESHHTMKRDAPSGTALRLAAALRENAGAAIPADRIHAIRAGDIIGEHAVQFAGPGERITISHSATSRDLFARGALRAAHWLAGKPAGRYTIEQSLGI